MLDRRLFLKSSGLALVAGGFLPGVFVRMAEAGTPASRRVLVAIFQRGAVDGLNVLVPHGEKAYYAARPTIAIPRPGSGGEAAHRPRRVLRTASVARAARPVLPGPLRRLRPRRRQPRRDALALRRAGLHGVGHAGREVDRRRLPRARARRDAAPRRLSPARGRPVRGACPGSSPAASGAIAMTSLADFGVRGRAMPRPTPVLRVHVRGRRRRSRSQATAQESFEAVRIVQLGRPVADRAGQRRRRIRAARSGNRSGRSRSSSSADVGLEIAFADVGGWDTHAGRRAKASSPTGCATSASRSPPSRGTSARGWPTSRS